MNKQMAKQVAGLLVIGFSCVFGTSWLYMAPAWMTGSGNFLTAALAIGLGTALIMVISLAYHRILRDPSNGQNEVAFMERRFGRRWAGMIGWCGFLTNLLLCAWQLFAFINALNYLFGGIKTERVLYGSFPHSITVYTLAIALGLLLLFGILHLRGINQAVTIQTVLTIIVLLTVIISVVTGIKHLNWEYVFPKGGEVSPGGIISTLAIVPFSIAGWENITKAVKEVAPGLSSKVAARIMTISILLGGVCYILMLFAQVAIVSPQGFLHDEVPFLTGMELVTGSRTLSLVVAVAAALNICNVFNGMFFGATRTLFLLAKDGYLPTWLGQVRGEKALPRNAIVTVLLIIAVVPFIGSSIFQTLVNVVSVFYVLLWGSTVLCNLFEKKGLKEQIVAWLAAGVILAMVLFAVIPTSPGALAWPGEYLFLGGMLLIGWFILAKNKNHRLRTYITRKKRCIKNEQISTHDTEEV